MAVPIRQRRPDSRYFRRSSNHQINPLFKGQGAGNHPIEMRYRLTYGEIVIDCDSADDLAAAVAALNRKGSLSGVIEPAGRTFLPPPNKLSSEETRARALFRAMVEAGAKGVDAATIGEALGTSRRGIAPAIYRWAITLGLVTEDEGIQVAQPNTINGHRGYLLTAPIIERGRKLLG